MLFGIVTEEYLIISKCIPPHCTSSYVTQSRLQTSKTTSQLCALHGPCTDAARVTSGNSDIRSLDYLTSVARDTSTLPALAKSVVFARRVMIVFLFCNLTGHV